MQSDTTVVSTAVVFCKKGATIIAIHVQKTLHWQISKVILSGTYNCNSEATNYKRMNKLEMDIGHSFAQSPSTWHSV